MTVRPPYRRSQVMSPTQDYQRGRFPEALACWGAQLAAGRSWSDVEGEILTCCDGRVDALTALLVQAETLRACGGDVSDEPDAGSPSNERRDPGSATRRSRQQRASFVC